jgi:hypothetical protein
VDIDALIFSIKNAFQKKVESTFVAAAFAEAGDHKTSSRTCSTAAADKTRG